MTARQIDDAARSLRDLRLQTVEDLGLAGIAFALALAASRLVPELALPLLAGGTVVMFLGLRSLVRRWLLLDDLAVQRDAYEIGDVRRFAARAAAPEHRRLVARRVRLLLDDGTERVEAVRPELERLAAALREGDRVLALPAAAASDHLVRDLPGRLADPAEPVSEIRTDLRRLLSGLEDV